MPEVGGKKYKYTKEGMAKAKKEKSRIEKQLEFMAPIYKKMFHNDGYMSNSLHEDTINKYSTSKKKADTYTGRTIKRKEADNTQRQRSFKLDNSTSENIKDKYRKKIKI